jgi:hypothetical protein
MPRHLGRDVRYLKDAASILSVTPTHTLSPSITHVYGGGGIIFPFLMADRFFSIKT